ncbi:MAG TPA: PDZ domain-containing protein [Verrucomicrobiae bacterium]|nr:PDZ domain-containing protein [Verrucomicrobiae bacterium]
MSFKSRNLDRLFRVLIALLLGALGSAHGQENGAVAWLGITTARGKLAPELSEKLGLPRGVGIVVRSVTADGPADRAGIEATDILTRLDDQTLINPPQLMTLVQNKKSGDRAMISLFREGKAEKITVTLGQAPEPPGTSSATKTNSVSRSASGPSTVNTIADDHYTITATSRPGNRTVLIKSKAGQVVYDGPYNTDVERERVPAELRRRIEQHKLFTDKFLEPVAFVELSDLSF